MGHAFAVSVSGPQNNPAERPCARSKQGMSSSQQDHARWVMMGLNRGLLAGTGRRTAWPTALSAMVELSPCSRRPGREMDTAAFISHLLAAGDPGDRSDGKAETQPPT